MTAAILAVSTAVAPFYPPLQEGDTVPQIPLVDEHARAFGWRDGRSTVLSFIYTRCAVSQMCPLTSSKFARLQRVLDHEPVRLVLVTLDPAFDRPVVLRAYGRQFGQDPARWSLLTGSTTAIDELSGRFAIASARTRPGVIVHDEAVITLDPALRITHIIAGNAWQPEAIVQTVRETGAQRSVGGAITLWLTAAAATCGRAAAAWNPFAALAFLIGLAGLLVWFFLRVVPHEPT